MMYRCVRIIHIFLSIIQYLLNLCGDPLHPRLTFSFCVFRNLQLNLLVVYGASDTCTQISKHRTRLCAPSCRVISGLESNTLKYVNLGRKSMKIYNCFSCLANRSVIITDSLKSQQRSYLHAHVFKHSANSPT